MIIIGVAIFFVVLIIANIMADLSSIATNVKEINNTIKELKNEKQK